MVKKWGDNDVTLDSIQNQTIAVIGYGIQGRAQANNLKDSGLNVVVGLRKDGNSWKIAQEDGQNVMEISDAARIADIIHILIPDMEQANAYQNEISSFVTENKALSFSHGASIHWKWIEPPTNVDVIMVAPKGPGQRVRELFQKGFGTPSLVAVYRDHTGSALIRVFALEIRRGIIRDRVSETIYKDE